MSRPLPTRAPSVLAALVLGAAAAAQLPPGHFAVAGGQTLPPFSAWTGAPGIYVGHPRTPGVMRQVTGLPPSLTAPLSNTPTNYGYYGMSGIVVHQPSGDLLVGDIPHGTTPNPVHLHRIRIDSQTLAVISHTSIVLGTTMGLEGDVNQIAQIDDDRVVVTCNNVTGAVGAGPFAIAEVNLATNAIAPWPLSSAFIAYQGQVLCIDRANDKAYLGGGLSLGGSSTIYEVPLATAANPTTTPTFVATVPIFLDNLQFEPTSGTILAGGRGTSPASGAIYRIDPNASPATVTPVLANWQNAPSITIEPATGDILFGGVQSPGATSVGIWHLPAGAATPTFLSNTIPTGMGGLPMGIAVAPAPQYYGAATVMSPSMPLLPWSHGVLPGGLPLVGNPSFALELDLPPTATLPFAHAAASFGTATAGYPQIPNTPLSLLVDLAAPNFLAGFPMSGPVLSFPIPSLPGLQGLTLHFQALTIANFGGNAGLGASDGARVTIL